MIEQLEQNGFSRFVDEPTFGRLIHWLVENAVGVNIYWLEDTTKYICELFIDGEEYAARGKSPKKALLKAIKELSANTD